VDLLLLCGRIAKLFFGNDDYLYVAYLLGFQKVSLHKDGGIYGKAIKCGCHVSRQNYSLFLKQSNSIFLPCWF
jgi:hypothetical protein